MTKDQFKMSDEDILREEAQSQEVPEIIIPTVRESEEVEALKEEELAVPEEAPISETKDQESDKPATMPTPPDKANTQTSGKMSPLDLIKSRKSSSSSTILSVIESRKNGGRAPMSVKDMIASRKSGTQAGVTVQDIIAQRKFPKKNRIL